MTHCIILQFDITQYSINTVQFNSRYCLRQKNDVKLVRVSEPFGAMNSTLLQPIILTSTTIIITTSRSLCFLFFLFFIRSILYWAIFLYNLFVSICFCHLTLGQYLLYSRTHCVYLSLWNYFFFSVSLSLSLSLSHSLNLNSFLILLISPSFFFFLLLFFSVISSG